MEGVDVKLVLRRNQRDGMLGKVVFTLDVRAELSADEKERIRKYKLGDTELYSSHVELDPGNGMLGFASRVAMKALSLKISVKDLEGGKRVEAKDVIELLAIEERIRDAAKTFKQVLDTASHFGGEEVVAL